MSEFNEPILEQDVELLPDPERSVTGLRDTGYNFNTAIADIVDNSIAANATKVSILVNMTPEMDVTIYIADNGIGMNRDGLLNAMKYGSKERPEKSSLGKFGLGLKTASTSFGKKLALVSRSADDDIVRKVQWDLDYIAEKGKWLLQSPAISDDELDMLDEITEGGTGTLVVWSKIDRLLKDYKSYTNARKGLLKYIEALRFHLSMVYQRFLDTADERAKNVEIILNDVPLSAWDPFCTKEPKTLLLQKENIPVAMPDGTTPSFTVAAYVIPRKNEFSSDEASKAAKGTNDFQGFYVYRENRLIHYGDWLGFFAKEPHFSLLRIEFSFDYRLDELLQVDIKKSRILLIGELAMFLEKFLAAPRREAEKRYRHGETDTIHTTGKSAHENSNNTIEQKAKDVEESIITVTGENEAQVTNTNGTFTKSISITTSKVPSQSRVVPIETVDGNALWEPALVDGKHAVYINESHPFYKKVYGPILQKSTVVEGLDSLLWALAEAENSTVNPSSLENYEDMRLLVSKILKKLVADLPDPEISE